MSNTVTVCSVNNERCPNYEFGKCNKILGDDCTKMVLDGQDKVIFDQKLNAFKTGGADLGNIGKLIEVQNFIHDVATRKWYENQKNK